MRNREKDAIEMAARKKCILENSFRLFSESTIDKVTMNNVADACGIGVATLYRYYKTKQALVLDVATWLWDGYTKNDIQKLKETQKREMSAADEYIFYLDSFIDLYRNHKDMMRFNQMFNIYVRSEKLTEEQLEPYINPIRALEKRFHGTILKGQADGTLRTDISEQTILSTTVHIMLAVVTRYSVGLLYSDEGSKEAERELERLKRMLLMEFTTKGACNRSPEKGQRNAPATG